MKKVNENKDAVWIVNYRQAGMYIKHGLKPVDMLYTDKIVYVFDREASKPLYDLWCKKELN